MQSLIGLLVVGALAAFWYQHRDQLRVSGALAFFLWACASTLVYLNLFGLLSFRWPLAGGAALFGLVLTTRIGITRSLNGAIVAWFLLLWLAATSTGWSLLPDYSFLRAGALAIMLLFAGLGASALAATPAGRIAVFLTQIAVAVCVFPVLLGGVDSDFGVTEVAGGRHVIRRFSGIEILRATGTAQVALGCAIGGLFIATWGPRSLRVVAKVVALVSLVMIPLAGARGAILIALAVVPPLWVSLVRGPVLMKVVGLYLLLAAAGVVVWGLLPAETSETILAYLRLDDPERITRTRMDGRWDVAVPKALEMPFLGRGFGTSQFYDQSDAVLSQMTIDPTKAFSKSYTHNQFISVFYDLGILGLALFLLPIMLTLQRILALYADRRLPRSEWAMGITMAAFWTQNLMGMMFHDGKLTIGNAGAFWFLIQTAWIWQFTNSIRAGRYAAVPYRG